MGNLKLSWGQMLILEQVLHRACQQPTLLGLTNGERLQTEEFIDQLRVCLEDTAELPQLRASL